MLTGVVLCGGQSTRMGSDKSKLVLHGTTLNEIAKHILEPFCKQVLFSINSAQNNLSYENSILDMFENEGPLSGILSSFYYLESPLLVLAVDMPNIKPSTVQHLIAKRNKLKHVTAYFDSNKQLWQGTLAIWEKSSYPLLQEFFANGGRSLQKFLNKIDAQKVEIENEYDFLNVNTRQDFDALLNPNSG